MANDKDKTTHNQITSNATNATALDGTEVLIIEQQSLNKVTSINAINTFVQSKISSDDDTDYLNKEGSITGSTSQAQSFGNNGIKTDAIAESTTGFGIALSSLTSFLMGTGLTATGTNQATALAIAQQFITFSTVAANTGGVLPTGTSGNLYIVINNGANPLNLYPHSTGTIDGGSASASISIPVGEWKLVLQTGVTTWVTIILQNKSTTAITPSAFTANTSAIADDSATWGGYTIGQVVAALKANNILT